MTAKTFSITQEGPANGLALNKDNSQVVIAGRNGNKVNTMLKMFMFLKTIFNFINIHYFLIIFQCSKYLH